VLGFSQNYQPIYSNSLQVFYQEKELSYWGEYEDGFGFNMWGTRIDSLLVESNRDSVFYNYPIYRDTTGDNHCIWWHAPNWNGTNTRIDAIGNAWFQNKFGESILIRFEETVSATWLAYTYPNGDSLIGTIESTDWVDDSWITDSSKTITLTRLSSGQVVEDSINQTFFEIYKNYGFRTMVDFTKFPTTFEQIFQVDPNTINLNSPPFKQGQNNYLGSGKPKPELGDGNFYRISSFSLPSYAASSNSTSKLFTDIDSSALDGSLVVTSTVNSSPSNSNTEVLIFIPNPDTIYKTLISESFGEIEGTFLPRMGGTAYRYNPGSDSCGATV
jgi:hypothetical protein